MFSAIKKTTAQASAYNLGLRQYFLGVYNYMTTGIALTGLVSFVFAKSGLSLFLMKTPLSIVISLLPLGLVLLFSAKIRTLSLFSAKVLFFVYSASIGVSISGIFLIFHPEDILKAFLIASSLFGFMSIYGYTTNKDLSKMGSVLIMAVFGLIIASLVNLFTKSSALSLILSFGSVIIFTGLAAFDTQNIKNTYYAVQNEDPSMISKTAVFGALQLYMDFINIFINLLYIFGAIRRDGDR
jgi:FtsH-binding integral membrane protein